MSEVFESLWSAPLSRRGTLRLSLSDAGVRLLGQEHGVCTVVGVQRVSALGVTLVLHEEGRKYWSSRGQQSYAGASMLTVLVEPGSGTAFRYVELCSVDVPRNGVERTERSFDLGRLLLGGWADPSHSC